MKRILALVSAFLVVFALASIQTVPVALAHAEPEDCTPPIDGTVDTVPAQVVCKTGQAMDPENSSLSVFNAAGEQVDLGDSAVDLNDPDRTTISVSLDTAKITDGVYTVKYATLSTEDNEEDEGEFHFTVQLASAAETPAVTETVDVETPTVAESPIATETSAAIQETAVTETPAAVETSTTAAAEVETETPAAVETPTAEAMQDQTTPTPIPAPVTTLPTTGGPVNYGLIALIAVGGLLILGAAAVVMARKSRKV